MALHLIPVDWCNDSNTCSTTEKSRAQKQTSINHGWQKNDVFGKSFYVFVYKKRQTKHTF